MAFNYFNQSDSDDDESIDLEDLEEFMNELKEAMSDYDEDDEDYEWECSDSEEDEEVLQSNVYKMQMHKYDLFKAQNQETGHFDVTFLIEGKYLYANKYPLITSSETLNAWLSDRWSTASNDPIKIETYSYDVFYQLCCFLYSGGCSLTIENTFYIIDAAEFFGLQLLKDYCETYIMQRRSKFVNENNLLFMMDLGDKYALRKFGKYVDRQVIKNLEDMLEDMEEDERFLLIKKCHLLRLFRTQKELYVYVSAHGLFEALIKWTEHHVQKKKEGTIDENFDYEEEMKVEFSEFLPYIKFRDLNVDSLIKILAEKSFLFAPSDFVTMFPECSGREDEIFKAVYHLAETRALKKQKTSSDKNFDLQKAIKEDLASIIAVTKFDEMGMGVDFVVEYLVEKSYLFPYSCKELLKILAECYRHGDRPEEKVFKAMYEVAEKEVLQKQGKKPIENFDLAKAVKEELAEFLPNIRFYLMDKKFLMEFVVEKGFLTHEEARGIKIIKVEIESGGNSLVGIFEDKLDILDTVGKNKIEIFSYKEMKQRFIRFKFTRPSTPSTLIKKEGIEWYLCLEWDGILAAKHRTILAETDYLISELKASGYFEYFRIKKNSNTSLKVTSL